MLPNIRLTIVGEGENKGLIDLLVSPLRAGKNSQIHETPATLKGVNAKIHTHCAQLRDPNNTHIFFKRAIYDAISFETPGKFSASLG